MSGKFACPECGTQVRPRGGTAGRQVRCSVCATLVEVPFLPRESPRRRSRSPRRRARRRLKRLVVLAGLFLITGLVFLGRYWGHVRATGRAQEAISSHLVTLEESEAAGDSERALAEADAALALAARSQVDPPAGLRARRDALARHAATDRLEAAVSLAPADALRALQDLRAQALRDAALAGLLAPIREGLATAAVRLTELQCDTACAALESGRGAAAFAALCEAEQTARQHVPAGSERARLESQVDALAIRLAAQAGVVVESVGARSRYFLGSPGTYEGGLVARVLDTLRARGYVPRPSEARWAAIWDQHAGHHLAFVVIEEPVDYMSSSALKASRIEVWLSLTRAGERFWQGHAVVRSRIPPPTLPAYLASRYAVMPRRSPEAERRLYDDARSLLVERIVPQTQGLPRLPETPTALVGMSGSPAG